MNDPTPIRSASCRRARRLGPLALAFLAVLLGGALACGDDADPVADLSVRPERVELPYGTFRDLDLDWSPSAELDGLEGAPRVFLHLVDEDGDLVRTFDQDLPRDWRAGGEMSHRGRIYQSLLAPPLPPGEYTLTAGLYDGAGNRWALAGVGEPVAEREYRVASVEVPSEPARVPATSFSPGWSPNQAGGDRQVIAFRTLSGEGAIDLSEIPSAGTLWVEIAIPPAEVAGMRRRIVDPPEGGDGMPRVAVASGCGGFESRVSGEGSHRIDVPVEASGGGAAESTCRITLRPNFVMEGPDGDDRSITLEVLAWSEG